MLKALKNFVRKTLIHPFGYDLVPLKQEPANAPLAVGTPPVVAKAGSENIDLYIHWFGEEAVRQRRFFYRPKHDL